MVRKQGQFLRVGKKSDGQMVFFSFFSALNRICGKYFWLKRRSNDTGPGYVLCVY